MGDRIYLNIETSRGGVLIPFKGLKELDYFTIGYENDIKLIESLNKILDLSLSIEDVISIYISSDRYKDTKNGSLSCIKYSGDNYNLDSLIQMLALYLKQDHRRIRRCDVRHVVTEGMIYFNAGYPISDNDIDLAVKVFLKSNYKKQRDMYFMIKEFGSIRVNELSKEEREKVVLSQMGTNDEDSFVQYLIELASRGEEELENIMNELSKVDLEDISKVLESGKNSLFDGLTDEEVDGLEDVYALEALTEMSVEQIKELQGGYHLSYNGHRR